MDYNPITSRAFVLLACLVGLVLGEITWAVPAFEIEFCALTPPQDCTEFRVNFVVNRADGPYSLTGGKDTKCRAVQRFDKLVTEWQKCDDRNLQWRWQGVDEEQSKMSLWPRDADGFTRIGIRQLNVTIKNPNLTSGQEIDGMEAELKFRETTTLEDRPDALLGCAVYNPTWPVRCSMDNILIFGFDPPKAVVLNITRAKLHI